METTPVKLPPAALTTLNTETEANTAPSSSGVSSAAKSMSSSVREKLKRARHSFRSPSSVVKRLKIEDGTTDTDGTEQDTDVNRNDVTRRQTDRSGHTAQNAQKHLISQREHLRKAVKERSETLRRLKMVQMYRKKNDLTQLQRLIDKWRSCSQSVLLELQRELSTEGKLISLAQLMDNFGLDDKLLHFDRTEEDFTET